MSTGATEITATRVGRYAELSDTVTGTYPTGTVTVTMMSGRATGTILFVTSNGGASWTCNTGTVASKYRPQACR